MKTLILPGYNGSGPEHWQSLWLDIDNTFVKIADEDFSKPRKLRWITNLERALEQISEPVMLVAHSLACHQVAHWASTPTKHLTQIAGALLVTPPDPKSAFFPTEAQDFLPIPTTPLPFPALIIASENDPYGELQFAQILAQKWQVQFTSVGPLGHINTDSQIGNWPQGQLILQNFIQHIGAPHGRKGT